MIMQLQLYRQIFQTYFFLYNSNNMDKLQAKLQQCQPLTEKEVDTLADCVIALLVQEPNIIEVSSPQHVVGDIHGQFFDFLKMIHEVIPEGSNCVFLGDYVDRGYHSIQTICYLLVLKCLQPHRFILLRGNHETSSLTRTYGFYDEVQRKYGNHSVWNRIVEVFTYLPLAAIIDNSLLCLHGGLSPSLPLLDAFTTIHRLTDIPENGPMCDLVWSDPDPSEREGWSLNSRGAGYLFSEHVVKEFLQLNQLTMIVRAHQLAEEGHAFNFGNSKSFVTVWSAPNYCYRCGNQAAVMKVEGADSYSFVQFVAAEQTSIKKIHFDNLLPYFL